MNGQRVSGIELDRVFPDKISCKNADWPQLQELVAYIREGDIVFVYSLDRLGRNLVDLHDIIQTITDNKASVTFVTENLTFTGYDSPLSILLLQVLGAFAHFQRMIIREAQREGIAIAKREGVYKGRKKKLTTDDVAAILQRIQNGDDNRSQIARDYGITRKTLYQHLKAGNRELLGKTFVRSHKQTNKHVRITICKRRRRWQQGTLPHVGKRP